jgi:acetyltransferase-like isoleucine patch superfamily enzyme
MRSHQIVIIKMRKDRLRAFWRMFLSRGRIVFGTNARLRRGTVIRAGRGTVKVGSNFEMKEGAIIDTAGGSVTIGNNCSLNPYAILYGHGGLSIGNDVRIAARVTIVPFNHVFDNPDIVIKKQGTTRLGIAIGDDVWIGAGATVLDGVSIASGCVIGAGAIVTKNTEVNGVYVGSPARLIRKRCGKVFN